MLQIANVCNYAVRRRSRLIAEIVGDFPASAVGSQVTRARSSAVTTGGSTDSAAACSRQRRQWLYLTFPVQRSNPFRPNAIGKCQRPVEIPRERPVTTAKRLPARGQIGVTATDQPRPTCRVEGRARLTSTAFNRTSRHV